MKGKIRRYFITGLLIWVPLGITFWVLRVFIQTMDSILKLLPEKCQPLAVLGADIPGLGVILTALVIFTTGLLAANMLGQKLVRHWETILGRIPIVKSIYHSVKQVSEAVFVDDQGMAFRKVLLVQFPHSEAWTLAFLTAMPGNEVRKYLGNNHVAVYVPTTPNPTSGYYIILPKANVVELEMSVEVALKSIISLGVASSKEKEWPEPS